MAATPHAIHGILAEAAVSYLAEAVGEARVLLLCVILSRKSLSRSVFLAISLTCNAHDCHDINFRARSSTPSSCNSSGCNKFIFSGRSSYSLSLPAPPLGSSCPSRISASRISFAVGLQSSPGVAAPTMVGARQSFFSLKLHAFF